VKTYLQAGCNGVVRNEHEGILNCPTYNLDTQHRTARVLMIIQDDTSQWQSAKILLNGVSDTGAFNLNINGHRVRIMANTCCYLNTLNTFDFSANWLRLGVNVVTLTYAGVGDAQISQVEIEAVTNQPRVMQYSSSMVPMPMLGVTTQNFRIDHTSTDPMVSVTNTFLYSLGSSAPLNYSAATVSSETPWLTVSPSAEEAVEINLFKPDPAMLGEEKAKELTAQIGKGPGWSYSVDNCRKTYDELLAKGVKFQSKPEEQPYGVEAVCEDLYGNTISLVQPAAWTQG